MPQPAPHALALAGSRKLTRSSEPLNFLTEFAEDLAIRKRRSETARHYVKTAKQFLDFIGPLPVWDVRPADIRAFLALRLKQGVSRATLDQEISGLRSFFDRLVLLDIIRESPARLIRPIRVKRRIPDILTIEQIDRLIAAGVTERDRALLEFAYETGCRVAEIAGVRVEHVNWSARSVKVFGKGSKERLVPLCRRAVEMLRHYLGDRNTGFLFQSDAQPDQAGGLMRGADGYWRGSWRVDYTFDGSTGKLKSRLETARLGRLDEISREEAKKKLGALLAGKLTPRPRPVSTKPLTTHAIRDVVYRAAARAGLGHVHPHQIRHSFATHLLERGADLFTISRWLGHETIATTAIYLHCDVTHLQKTIRRFHPHGEMEEKS